MSVVARSQFWRRKVTIVRYHPGADEWRAFRKVVLTAQNAPGEVVWTTGYFSARLPGGTRLRAVLPAAQAGPCYVAGTSAVLRT